MSDINPQQRQAIHHTHSPCLVLAGAGSGKTLVITRKIVRLIEELEMQPRHITAVTFTNKAAREMDARVGRMLTATQSKGLRICTFHRLGLHILESELARAGYRSNYSILDEEDTIKLLGDLDFDDSDSARLKNARWQISDWKNNLLDPASALSRAKDATEQHVANLYQRYQQALQTYNAFDFDDLILQPVQLLQRDPQVREKWQQRIRHLLIDEYQDTNLAQYEMVRLLVGNHGVFTAVGDDDQSIYAWRGARPENLLQLSKDYPGLEVIRLEQNYRSTARILKCANHVIRNNGHLFEKSLWSELGMGDPVQLIKHADEEQELDWIVQDIQIRMATQRRHFTDFAVLYRGNHQSRLLELKLRGQGIPYRISGSTSFYSRTEIKDVMAYLRLLINADDDVACLRIINTPRRQIGPATISALSQYAGQRGTSLLRACTELGLSETLPEPGLARLRSFGEWFEQKQRNLDEIPARHLIDELLKDINYQGWLFETCNSAKVAESRWRNIDLLVNSISSTIDREGEDMTFAGAVAKTQLRDMLESMAEESAEDKVSLMTLHAAKGLEFREVYLIGMEDGTLPHKNSLDEDRLEEERRLFYVGITRARERLTLSLCGSRSQFGERTSTVPSRFIEELPEEELERRGFDQGDKQAQETQTQASRAALQSLFS